MSAAPVPAPANKVAAPAETGLAGSNTRLARMLKAGLFTVAVEFGPPVGPNYEAVQRQIAQVRGCGDVYNVTDNQSAVVHMSSLATGIMLKQAGLDPVVQFTCRDRNRIGLQSDLIGAAAFGIDHVLCLSGDHPIWGDHPGSKPVFDVDSINLIRIVRMMRNNQVFENGKTIPRKGPDFFIGAVENPFAPPYEYRPYRLAKKIVAGAQFIQTQLIYNVDRFREFMAKVVDLGLHEQVAIMAGVGPVRSLKAAEYMRDEVAGNDVPEWVTKRLEGLSKEDAAKAGIDICCEVAEKVRNIEGVRGLHVMAVNWADSVPMIVKNLGLYPRPALDAQAPQEAATGKV